ncbi:MAG: tetratricopeptide repeat protein, partial [Deltaproteobacteria bacterium]|nr:tetratricopeptide repeat protein [Deltaproteobacteria bacterium]
GPWNHTAMRGGGSVVGEVDFGAAAAWGGLWGGAARDQLARAFTADHAPAFAVVDAALARYGERWQAMHRTVCLAHQRGEESDQVLDQRMACLGERRTDAAALIALLNGGDHAVRARAIDAIGKLSSIDDCDGRAITERAPLPSDPRQRAAIAEVDAQVATAKAQSDAARYAACHASAEAALPAARAADYPPQLARLLFLRAYCSEDVAAAIADLHAAAAAERGRDDPTLVRIWSRLEFELGYRLGKFGDAAIWNRYAHAALDRTGGNDEAAYGLYANEGLRLDAEGKYDDALARFALLEPIATRLGGPSSPRHAAIEGMVGSALVDAGRPADALAHFQRSLALDAALHGPDSPTALDLLGNIASTLLALDRVPEALALFPRMRAIQDAADPGGDDSFLRHRYASALRLSGDYAAALVEDLAAEATCTKFAGPDARVCAVAFLGEGWDRMRVGPPTAAVAAIERALRLYGDQAPAVAWFALARARPATERARAITAGQKAAAILRADVARGAGDPADLAEIEAWVRDHGGP